MTPEENLPVNFTPEATQSTSSTVTTAATQPTNAATTTAAQPAAPTGEEKMGWLQILIAALEITPYIAQGVVTIKHDCDLNDKKKAAQDSLSVLTNAALAVVPDEHKELATAAAGAAQTTMDAVVTALHTAQQTPVPAVSLPAAA